MYKIEITDNDRILDIAASGFWTLPEAERYIAELKAVVDVLRQRSGRVRAMVNALDMLAQSGELMEMVADVWNELMTGPEDRLAFIVQSSLAKSQAKRLFRSKLWQAFLVAFSRAHVAGRMTASEGRAGELA